MISDCISASGSAATIASVEVAWPSGKKETYKDLPADIIYTIVEDNGISEKKTPFAVFERTSEDAKRTTRPTPK